MKCTSYYKPLLFCALALTACAGDKIAKTDQLPDDGGLFIPDNEPDYTETPGDNCQPVEDGVVVFSYTKRRFPIYECTDAGTPSDEDASVTIEVETDSGVPPQGGSDAGTPPGDSDGSVTPPQGGSDAGTPSGDSDGGSSTGGSDSGTSSGGSDDGGVTPPQDDFDSGTPPGETDGGTPPQGDLDAGSPPGDTDGGVTPPQDDVDSGTPPGETDGGCDHGNDGGGDGEEPLMCNRKVTVVVHSGATTTYFDEVLHCTFSIENDAVNTRVVRSCDKETETAETKVIGVVGESGQLKVILSTPHRCGHYHEL